MSKDGGHAENEAKEGQETTLPAALPAGAKPAPSRAPLLPERSDFLEGGDRPAAAQVEAFLTQAFAVTGRDGPAQALVPWICDTLLSNHSVKAYGRDLMDFVRHTQAQGVDPLHVTADHVKLYKRALLEAGRTSATVARRLSVIRGVYKELAAKGLVAWETAQDIAAVDLTCRGNIDHWNLRHFRAGRRKDQTPYGLLGLDLGGRQSLDQERTVSPSDTPRKGRAGSPRSCDNDES